MIKQNKVRAIGISLIFAGVFFLTGCGGAYKASGQYKRDLLLDRIEKARKSYEQAKNQFEVVLTNYSGIIDANAGDIRSEYNKLNRECKRARKFCKDISRKIKDVESVGKPLFRDWEDGLAEYQNEVIRRSSEEQLDATRSNYLKLIHSMKVTGSSVSKVLASLDDQVLYLSHNLNTKALTSFKKEATNLKEQVNDLVTQMQKAIMDAEIFIDENGSVVLTKLEDEE